jgi:hypothetical protein
MLPRVRYPEYSSKNILRIEVSTVENWLSTVAHCPHSRFVLMEIKHTIFNVEEAQKLYAAYGYRWPPKNLFHVLQISDQTIRYDPLMSSPTTLCRHSATIRRCA